MRSGKKKNQECGCNSSNIITCICELDQKINCIKDAFGHKQHLGRIAKEKILFCILLREIDNLDRKLDKIIRELDCDWGIDGDTDKHNHCQTDSDGD